MSVTHLLSAAEVATFTPERIWSTVAAVAALAGAVVGGLVLTRRVAARSAVPGLVISLLGLVAGALVVLTADGGLGTGNGLGGGVVAVVLGLAGTVLGGLAVRRAATDG